jgi:cell division protein FtsW
MCRYQTKMQTFFQYLQGDRTIWLIALLLSLFSVLAVYSATGSLAFQQSGGNTEYYLFKQITIVGIGLLLMYGAHLINYNYYSRIAQLLLYISIPLLIFTLLFGRDFNDAQRWLKVPLLNITFQTSDFAKFALIMYTARVLSKKREVIKDFDKGFMPIIAPVVLVCFLIVPANLSTAAVLFFTCMVLMFIGRVSTRHLLMTIWIGITALLLFVSIAYMTGRKGRLETWKGRIFNYWSGNAETGEHYQVQHAKMAIANGGLLRVAPGKSVQQNFLPQPYSDYIYAIIIEEYGLLGGMAIMFLYLAFFYRSIKIFARSPGAFGAFLAVGLSISLVIQALMNMAVTVDLLPVTGLNLPLVSMGGTSVLFSSISIGVILSVSRNIEQQEKALI